jgi:thiamine biosynthesis lipoprotein
MKQTRIMMGMPITVEVVDPGVQEELFDRLFDYFAAIDQRFSTYKEDSEISQINRHELAMGKTSQDMRTIFALAEQYRLETGGFFDIRHGERYDPSGVVKGWAIANAVEMVRQSGFENFYVEAGGDFQAVGKNGQGHNWRVGIRNPFKIEEIIKVLSISDRGVATSGTYVRGQHIYNPHDMGMPILDAVSITVIGPDICSADCFATAAFAMGREGIDFIESLTGYEGYLIDKERMATFTSGFERYVLHDEINRQPAQ